MYAASLGIDNITMLYNTVTCSNDDFNLTDVMALINNDTQYLYENTIYVSEV